MKVGIRLWDAGASAGVHCSGTTAAHAHHCCRKILQADWKQRSHHHFVQISSLLTCFLVSLLWLRGARPFSLAAEVPLPREVRLTSQSLWGLLFSRHRQDAFHMTYWNYRTAILQGEVDFYFMGDNMLELAASNAPRHIAQMVGSWMLDGGSDVNGQSRDGFTPLLSACSRGLSTLATTLLQRGANRFKRSPTGQDPLDCALGFFGACVEFRSRENEDDVDLCRLCFRLRNSRIERARSLGQLPSSPVAEARLRLSQVATQLALLGGKFVKLSKEEVLALSGLDPEALEGSAEALWRGWPGAFLTFDHVISEDTAFQVPFIKARTRVLAYRLSQNKGQPRRFHYVGSDCDSDAGESYVDEYKEKKSQMLAFMRKCCFLCAFRMKTNSQPLPPFNPLFWGCPKGLWLQEQGTPFPVESAGSLPKRQLPN